MHGHRHLRTRAARRGRDGARAGDDVLAKGLPWLVAERDGQVLGYAYANRFRPRPAYRFCVEDSIYLRRAGPRPGRRRLLLAELMARCEAAARARCWR